MKPTIVVIPVNEIVDWNTFHAVFARELGFPEFYGRNMNAWVDCMTSIDEPDDGMSTVHGTKEAGMLLDLGDCTDFARRCPAQYEAILDSTGFVNHRRIITGDGPVLLLSFRNNESIVGNQSS